MRNLYKSVAIIAIVLAMTMIVSAYDPRVAYAVPYLAPDPSLKTTDPMYGNMGAEYVGPIIAGYQLPPIFQDGISVEDLTGGAVENKSLFRSDLTPDAWMNTNEHDKKLNSETKHITALSSYDVTEDQMRRGNITNGAESWL